MMKSTNKAGRLAGSVALLLVLILSQSAPAASAPATSAPAPRGLWQSEDDGWPRQIDDPRATIIMYQPEVEEFRGNTLSGRAAVSVTAAGDTTPRFGALWGLLP